MAHWARISIPTPPKCKAKAMHSKQERRKLASLPISTDGWQDIGLALKKSLQISLNRFFARERDVDCRINCRPPLLLQLGGLLHARPQRVHTAALPRITFVSQSLKEFAEPRLLKVKR